jgi:flavin-dependent dehydrogenase
LLVERRRTIGVPVQCAEYIPALLLGKLNLGRKYVVQSVRGMRTFCGDEQETLTKAPGYVIRRDHFDQALAQSAVEAGVTILTATRVIARDGADGIVLKPKGGNALKIHPRIVIGADGPHSTVGAWAGALNHHLLPGAQLQFKLCAPLQHTEVYFRPDITAGYGWLFPKGELANVGLGMVRPPKGANSIGSVLAQFVADLKARHKIVGAPVGHTAGWIPAEPVRRAVYGRLVLAGDAAGHTHPITGAGIFSAVTGGRMAGRWAGRAVQANDDGLLTNYDQEWQELMADTLQRAHQRRCLMEEQWENFSATVQKCWVAYRDYYVDK